ncbi:MAG TPA: hypothetical protein VM031_06445 [Phycisphaerae bacterium]|nr:hypothetical protein [Phycisphaerae bacterium]
MEKIIARHASGVVALALLAACVVGCAARSNEQFLGAGIVGDPNVPAPGDPYRRFSPSLARGPFALRPAPDWVKSLGQWVKEKKSGAKGQDLVYLVGRSVGRNVLDERNAYDLARNDALRQMARRIVTRVIVDAQAASGKSGSTAEADGATYAPMLGRISLDPIPFLPGAVSAPYPWFRNETAVAQAAVAMKAVTNAMVGDMEEQGVYWEKWYVNERPRRLWAKHRGMLRYKCWVLMGVPREKFEKRVQLTAELLLKEAATRLVRAKATEEVTIIRRQSASKAGTIDGIFTPVPRYTSEPQLRLQAAPPADRAAYEQGSPKPRVSAAVTKS